MQQAQLTRADIALVDTETGDLRVVRELPFAALSLSWQAGTP
jgi:hypothetical protein